MNIICIGERFAGTIELCAGIGGLGRPLGTQAFLAGDKLSIADIVLAPQLDFFAATPEGKSLLTDTRLAAWLERTNARPSMVATERPEEFRRAA